MNELESPTGVQVQRMVRPLCRPRKRHLCRLCDEWIEAGEPCERWSGLCAGKPFTSHAHPECYALTDDWDEGDWECCMQGDVERPNERGLATAPQRPELD